MINPGFVINDDTREKVWILGDLRQIFQTDWMTTIHFFGWKQWGTLVEQTYFIQPFFVKMCWIDFLGMCRSSVSFQMDEWQSSSIITDTVDVNICHNNSQPPICMLNFSRLLRCVNALCHLRIVELLQSFILGSLFQQSECFYFDFYYASIRSLLLQCSSSGCFFDIGSAISQCGTTIEQHYSRRKCGEGGRKEQKVETRWQKII